jgi:hypothetical protein
MTQDEFDDLIQEIREEDPEQLDSEFFVRDKPLKEDKVAKLEQKAGFALPEEYRNFLRRHRYDHGAFTGSGKRLLALEKPRTL